MDEKDDANSVALCGLTDGQMWRKHIRIRGSRELKYPPPESACHSRCGKGDTAEGTGHRCSSSHTHSRSLTSSLQNAKQVDGIR